MKTARGILILSLAMVLCLGVMGTGIAAGGNGNGNGNGNRYGNSNSKGAGGERVGNGTGACIASDIVTAPEVTIEGTVSDVGNYGQGVTIDTGIPEEDPVLEVVFGIGPARYWEDEDVARPAVGDVIEVTGREVTFSDGSAKIIIFTVTFIGTDDEIVLRDDDTGLPLWRRGVRF